jgi:hypothetical protein
VECTNRRRVIALQSGMSRRNEEKQRGARHDLADFAELCSDRCRLGHPAVTISVEHPLRAREVMTMLQAAAEALRRGAYESNGYSLSDLARGGPNAGISSSYRARQCAAVRGSRSRRASLSRRECLFASRAAAAGISRGGRGRTPTWAMWLSAACVPQLHSGASILAGKLRGDAVRVASPNPFQ